ncbi:MAG: YkgJ family cysteine cluster protein [Rectinemataceae bacterium]|nr:YkgJ family cysteine cluster protein [Rectinemataceae bacterium]
MHENASSRGLRFECQQCSFCCRGSPGFVWLSEADISGLCAYFAMDLGKFSRSYCRSVEVVGGRALSLKEKSGYSCIFLENGICAVYAARPVQCRSYPFWEEIIDTETSWASEASFCPGIGKGSPVPPETIASAFLEMRTHPRRVFTSDEIEGLL